MYCCVSIQYGNELFHSGKYNDSVLKQAKNILLDVTRYGIHAKLME